MKYLNLILVFLTVTLLFSACTKDEDMNPNPSGGEIAPVNIEDVLGVYKVNVDCDGEEYEYVTKIFPGENENEVIILDFTEFDSLIAVLKQDKIEIPTQGDFSYELEGTGEVFNNNIEWQYRGSDDGDVFDGCTAIFTKTSNDYNANLLPVPYLSISAYTTGQIYCGGYDPDGYIAKFILEDGLGNQHELTESGHINIDYPNQGTYQVKLTTIDNDGGSATITKQVEITSPASLFPIQEGTTWQYQVEAKDDWDNYTDSGTLTMRVDDYREWDGRITLKLTGKTEYLNGFYDFNKTVYVKVKQDSNGEYTELLKQDPNTNQWKRIFKKGASSWSGMTMLLARNGSLNDGTTESGAYTVDVPYDNSISTTGVRYQEGNINDTTPGIVIREEERYQEYYNITDPIGLVYAYSYFYYQDSGCFSCPVTRNWINIKLKSFSN